MTTALRCAMTVAICLLAWNARAQVKKRGPCVLDVASVMAFGQYDPMSTAPLDGQGRVSYRCGKKLVDDKDALIVQISLSTGQAGTFQRYMTGGRDRLRYNLYLDPVRTIVWGDGTGGTQAYTSKAQANNKVTIVPVFGRIVAEQDVAASVYLDTIIVTLDF